MNIKKSVIELIGNTPLVELCNLEKKLGLKAKIYAKVEALNPGGSIKDKAALYMIKDALDSGKINLQTKIIEPLWLETMLGTCQREDVGIVGAKLLDTTNKVYHAGIILGLNETADYIHKGIDDDDPGFFARAIIRQNLTAVSGLCMLTKRKIYEELGYLNEELKQSFIDVDFCLKARKKGYLVVYEPTAKIYYYEENDKINNIKDTELFKKLWKKEIQEGDPYYNKNLDLNNTNCLIRTDKVN